MGRHRNAVKRYWRKKGTLSRNCRSRKCSENGIEGRKKRQRYVYLFILCKMSASKRKAASAKMDNEDLVTWYQKIFIRTKMNEIITELPNLFEPNVYTLYVLKCQGGYIFIR